MSIRSAVVAAALVFGMITPATAQDVPDPVRIGIEGAYPPFNFVDSAGNLGGFDYDIMSAICEAQDLSCEFVVQAWDGIMPGLLSGKYDLIIGMGITEERKKTVDFTGKYWTTASRFVGAKDAEYEYTPDGLDGVSIGIQRGAFQENYVNEVLVNSIPKVYGTLDEAYLDLQAGRVDLVFASGITHLTFLDSDEGASYAFKGPDYSDPAYFGDGVGMAVRQGEEALRDTISEGILEIRSNGQYAEINETYFPFDIYGD